jgi:RHS repeat-associated protein
LVSEFTYDGFGRRVKIFEKTNNVAKSTNWFVWCETELCEERGPSGSTVTKRFFGTGEQISGTNYFFLTDHLGSVREMTDTNQTVRARYEFDPYGRRIKVSGDVESDFAFTGHYYHQASGLQITLFRAYDAETGRWVSKDPTEERDGLNLYAYVSSDPVNWIDPNGLTKVHVNGEIWLTPKLGDLHHIHVYQGRDQGPHWHGPNGQKFFPQTRMIRDKNGKWDPAPPKFVEAWESAVRRKPRLAARWLGLVSKVGIVFAPFAAQASGQIIGDNLVNFACDKARSADDWALVDALSVRHELNQNGLFAGDIAMRSMYQWK